MTSAARTLLPCPFHGVGPCSWSVVSYDRSFVKCSACLMCLCISGLIPEHLQLVAFEHIFTFLTIAILPPPHWGGGEEAQIVGHQLESNILNTARGPHPRVGLLGSHMPPDKVCWPRGTNKDREMRSWSPSSQSHPRANLARPNFCQWKVQEKSTDQSKTKYRFLYLMYSNFLLADLMEGGRRASSSAICMLQRLSCQK